MPGAGLRRQPPQAPHGPPPGVFAAHLGGFGENPGAEGRSARSYHRKGLDGTARTILDVAVEHGVAGASVLEIGRGVGCLHLVLNRVVCCWPTTGGCSPLPPTRRLLVLSYPLPRVPVRT